MANGIQYSASDYGNASGGTALDTYKDEIAQSEKDLAAVATAAKMSFLQKQEKDRVNATAVYGQALGNMYEGDRAAVEMMRDHVRNQFESGGYQKDPESYAKAVAQLNNMSTKFSGFYNETYGTGSANGQGTTYMDMQFNQSRGVENPYEAEGMKYNPENDPFDQANSTLEYMNRGGYAPNSLRVNEDGIMMARAITYSRDGNHVIGEEMPLDQLPHRQAGAQAFMPDLVENNQSMHDLAMKDKAGILAIQGLIDPDTNKPYTIDDANEKYFRNNVAEDPRFLRDILREAVGGEITPDMIEDYGNGTGTENHKALIDSTLYGNGEDTKGLLGDWQDAARFGAGGDPEATPTTLTHRVIADMPTQSSPGGGITQYSENYNVNAESITPIPITNSQHGDYSIEGISQDHLGNRYVLIPKKTRVFIGPDGEPRTWESLNTEEIDKVTNGLWDIEDRDMPEYVMISGDVGAYPDPRVAEILQNLPSLGERFTRIGLESQDSYNTIQENYNLRLQSDQDISNANSEVDPIEDVLESSTNPNTGGGVSTQSVNTGGGVSTQSANTGGGNIVDQFTRSLQGAEGAVPAPAPAPEPLTAVSTASAQNPADVLTRSEGEPNVMNTQNADTTEDDAQAKLREEEVVAEAQGREVDYSNVGFDEFDTREGESVGQSMERQKRTREAVETISAINFEGDFWGSNYGNPEETKKIGLLDPSSPQYEAELQAAIGKYGYPPEGSMHKDAADGLIDIAEFTEAAIRNNETPDVPTSEAELRQRQEGGLIRNPDPDQIDIAQGNASAAQEIINSEASTPTQESRDLIVNEMQNSSEVISTDDLTQMTPVDLAMRLVGKHEREDREFVQGMMDRWVGKDELDVTKGTGAWCAAFVSSVLADTGHEDALDPVRSGEAYPESDSRRGFSQYNYVRAQAFEAIGTAVDPANAAVGDVIVIVGSRGGSSRHVGFFNGYDSRGNVRILGGNQGIRGGEVSNMTLADLNRVVAIRRPFEGSATESQIAEVSEAIAIPTDISASNSTLR